MKLQNIAIYESNHSLKVGVITISLAEAIKARKMLCNLTVGRDELFKGIVIISRQLRRKLGCAFYQIVQGQEKSQRNWCHGSTSYSGLVVRQENEACATQQHRGTRLP